MLSLADGGVRLDPAAGPAPPTLGSYQHYGISVAPPQRLTSPTNRVTISYRAEAPAGARAIVDVRGSPDGERWLPWQMDVSPGATVGLPERVALVQYRVALLGGPGALPAVSAVTLQAQPAEVSVSAQASDMVAPTFRIRATRQGMIGGRTANGHIITPRDRFVSLPCWCSLSTRTGREYQVRLTYRGRTSVVPVMDVGPYNTADDYWMAARKGFPELERGWPQDHAAFYEGHSGGWAKKGYVRFPTAVDVGDGAWWDDLGIVGDQAELEITLLWMGSDPLAGKQPRAAAPEHTVDELSPDFWRNTPQWDRSPVGCGAGRHAFWAPSVIDVAGSGRVARWQPILPEAGLYELFVHVPICPARQRTPPTTQARYVVQHAEGALEVPVNQATQTGWVSLGRYPFAAGDGGFIQLSDVTGAGREAVWFDQARWVRVSP